MIAVGALLVGLVLGLWPGFWLGVRAAELAAGGRYDRFRAAALLYIQHGREVADLLDMLLLDKNAEAMRRAVDTLERALSERPGSANSATTPMGPTSPPPTRSAP